MSVCSVLQPIRQAWRTNEHMHESIVHPRNNLYEDVDASQQVSMRKTQPWSDLLRVCVPDIILNVAV